MNWSIYSKRIFETVINGENIFVNSVAGSGKTTNLVHIVNNLIGNKKAMVVAFNRHICDEISAKINNPNALVSTMHSIGNKIISKRKKVKLDSKKYFNFFKSNLPSKNSSIAYNLESVFILSKMMMIEQDDLANFLQSQLIDIEIEEAISLIKKAEKFAIESVESGDKISFFDMLYYPVKTNKHLFKPDIILVDESQDLSVLQAEFIRNHAQNAQVIFFGDVNQAIYAFAGADAQSVKKLTEKFNCVEMPLSVCYRCPSSHVELASKIVPRIEAAPSAIKGEVNYINFTMEKLKEIIDVKEKTLIISRYNYPLIKLVYQLVRNGIPAKIKGKDIGKSLSMLALEIFGNNNFCRKDLNKIKEYQEKIQKFAFNESIIDKIECLKSLIENYFENYSSSMNYLDVEKIIDQITDEDQNVLLCSIHRAKGLECDHTIFLFPEKIPHPKAEGIYLEQEYNLKYVALTRSKRKLTFVS